MSEKTHKSFETNSIACSRGRGRYDAEVSVHINHGWDDKKRDFILEAKQVMVMAGCPSRESAIIAAQRVREKLDQAMWAAAMDILKQYPEAKE